MLIQTLHLSLEDVVKIPELVEHFQEHQKEYGDNFISFLNKHYGSEKAHHETEENEEHQNLPFHHSHHLCVDLKVDTPLIGFVNRTIPANQPEHFFVYQPPQTAIATHSLFQPPKNNC